MSSLTPDERIELRRWRDEVESRAACRTTKRPARGASGPRPGAVAADAWKCEGRWQCDEQMDIWQCLDEVVLDELRKHGEDDSDDD